MTAGQSRFAMQSDFKDSACSEEKSKILSAADSRGSAFPDALEVQRLEIALENNPRERFRQELIHPVSWPAPSLPEQSRGGAVPSRVEQSTLTLRRRAPPSAAGASRRRRPPVDLRARLSRHPRASPRVAPGYSALSKALPRPSPSAARNSAPACDGSAPSAPTRLCSCAGSVRRAASGSRQTWLC